MKRGIEELITLEISLYIIPVLAQITNNTKIDKKHASISLEFVNERIPF